MLFVCFVGWTGAKIPTAETQKVTWTSERKNKRFDDKENAFAQLIPLHFVSPGAIKHPNGTGSTALDNLFQTALDAEKKGEQK